MGKLLLIAEKPSLMKDIQATYRKHQAEVESWTHGEVIFTALAGHACRFIEPSEYSEWDKRWEDIALPMIPSVFKIAAIPGQENKLKNIKSLMDSGDYSGVIVATDPDVEGNGIYYLIEHYLGISSFPAYRYFYKDQTDAGLLEGFRTLTDFHVFPRDVHMTQAYLIRSQMDWLIGMNFSVGFSVRSGFTMKVGRVKAPTLKLVYDNCNVIDNFVPHTDYAVQANYGGTPFSGTALNDEKKELRFERESDANDFIRGLGKSGVVVSVEKKLATTPVPQLYKLGEVQVDAGKQFGYSPERVTELVQSLYETHKVMSYPRTSGKYISSDKAKELPVLLKAVAAFPKLKPYVDAITPADIAKVQSDKRIVNDAEVAKSSHDALIPTGKIPDLTKLSMDERNVCELVYKRLLAAFFPALKENKVVALVDIDGNLFKSNGKTVVDKGWTAIYDKKLEENELPPLKKGDRLTVASYATVGKTTTPPARLTEATLIDAMMNIAKYITDKDLKSMMKEAEGIGMESSRSAIVKDLIKAGYMESKGKALTLYITEKGRQYIDNLKVFTICQPELTAHWETKMKHIREGSLDYNSVHTEMLAYVKDTIHEIETSKITRVAFGGKNASGIICPACGANLILGKYGYFCPNKSTGQCSVSFPDTLAGKKLTESMVKDLCTKGTTKVLKGFTSKAGKKFDAMLKLNVDKTAVPKTGKIVFEFDNGLKAVKGCSCPVCGKNVVDDKWSWKCEGGCGFAMNHEIAQRKMTEDDLKDMCKNKSTKKLPGFVSKAGKPFEARLVLDDGKIKFSFS